MRKPTKQEHAEEVRKSHELTESLKAQIRASSEKLDRTIANIRRKVETRAHTVRLVKVSR